MLNAVNVSSEDEKPARATVGELHYSNMRASILNIFGYPGSLKDQDAPPVKEEFFYSGSRRTRRRVTYRAGRGTTQILRNSKGRDGQQLKCCECGSTTHLLPYCPNKLQQRSRANKDSGPRCFACNSTKYFIADFPERE